MVVIVIRWCFTCHDVCTYSAVVLGNDGIVHVLFHMYRQTQVQHVAGRVREGELP